MAVWVVRGYMCYEGEYTMYDTVADLEGYTDTWDMPKLLGMAVDYKLDEDYSFNRRLLLPKQFLKGF